MKKKFLVVSALVVLTVIVAVLSATLLAPHTEQPPEPSATTDRPAAQVGPIPRDEVRDIAIRAALTGHLVFSTLHTNDAPGAITRLIDMGVEPFLISSSVIGVLSQRLVRTICAECKGKGCKGCLQTGYRGRIGIYELLIPSEKIRALITAKASADEIRKTAIEAGMQLLREDGQKKVANGITTEQEVMRVTEEV